MGDKKMDRVEQKLQRLIYAFIMLVIIIVAVFATTVYYYETKYISKIEEKEVLPLFAKAFVDENVGTTPLAVNFSPLLVNFKGTPTYHWDFGDGNTSNATNPTHNYTKEGNYTCNLIVTDITGENVTTSVKVIVLVNRPPTVVVLVSPVDSPRPHIPVIDYFPDKLLYFLVKALGSPSLLNRQSWINCEGQAFDPEGGEIVSYEWELIQPPLKFIGTTYYPKFYFEGKDLKNITFPLLYTYRWSMYSIKLTVTDSAGNTASDVKTFGVGASDVVMRRANIKKKWSNFWDVQFYALPTTVQDTITNSVWGVLGPIQTSMDNMTDRILAPLPEKLRLAILSIYGMLWEQQEKTYRKPNNPPNIPSDPSPADNATGVDLNANLNWTCSDPDDHPMTYDIYFGRDSPPPLVIEGYDNTTLGNLHLDSGTTYYWKIVAKDYPPTGDVKTATSPIWKFTTT